MPTLTIDNQTITVADGSNVLEAAKALGIVIPHFCYHEALGAVGACRLCAMHFEEGPVKGIQMSCMVPAKDGMVVSTVHPEAAELRSHIIEWMMMNHPHDCPVCDEGGECQLQDMTIAGGHGIRRYRGKKRTWLNQDLGPFVVQEMNRCIQCYRCVRTYQDYCGGVDFGVLGSRDRLFFGRFAEGTLESPFSGNLIDVCPTGVFTAKPFRFTSRVWDLEEGPSICPHCSLGCATLPGARNRQLQRIRARINPATNGFFICDRGRFATGYVNRPDRPRTPRIDGAETTWPEALEALRSRLATLIAAHGAECVALLGSPRASLEANALLGEMARTLGTPHFTCEPHPDRDRAARAATLLGPHLRSLEEIRGSDLLILLGSDPANEAPILALALRQAVRGGGTIAILDPRPVKLPCEAAHLPLSPERLPAALEALTGGDLSGFSRSEGIVLEGLRQRLAGARKPVLVGGADLLGAEGVHSLVAAVSALSSADRPCGGFVTLAGPDSFGGALLAGDGPDFTAILNGMEQGSIKALVSLQADPFLDHGNPGQAETALARLELLVALDYCRSETLRRADIVLPTTALPEESGTLVNNEGRILPYGAVFAPGTPIAETGAGGHPPRTFAEGTPGSAPRPAWAILAELQGSAATLGAIRTRIAAGDPRFADLPALSAGGLRIRPGREGTRSAAAPVPAVTPILPAGALALIPVETFLGSGLLESLSSDLDPLRPEMTLLLSPGDAAAREIAHGDAILLTTDLGTIALTARVSATLPGGTAILPRLRGSALAPFVPGSRRLFGTIAPGGTP